jgi:hypothetical protein
MISQRRALALINLFGGIAVLGSYAYYLISYPARAGDFWGGVPDGLRPVYTVNMFLAAAGYFAFTFFLMYRLRPTNTGSTRFGLGTFNALYALILIPSALWMPLTFAMLEAPSEGLWWAIRLTLAAVGIGSLGLLAGLVGGSAVSAFAGAQAGRGRKPGLQLPDGGPGRSRMARLLPGLDQRTRLLR